MGHVRNYTIGDVLSRFMRMNGKNVLQPMGWDAFGLPAENAAMANGVPPAKWTFDNIAYMKAQLKSLGFASTGARELATCRSEYYRWNQWLFLRMLERGIAYQKTGVVNWDPVDKTVLANEQVIDGRGWRTGALVEKREIPMYYLKITAYAEDLLDALDHMPGWPERVRAMQANWIGKQRGRALGFPYDIDTRERLGRAACVFTTRADTLMGVTFCAVAAEHPLATARARATPRSRRSSRNASAARPSRRNSRRRRRRAWPPGCTCAIRSPARPMPVWVGNYVLMSYGEGAVMGVPAHDERDFEFAKKYHSADQAGHRRRGPRVFAAGVGAVVRRAWPLHQFRAPTTAGIRSAGRCDRGGLERARAGRKRTTWRLRDWGISRQRYWGCPIPLIHCERCGTVPVPDEQLPVVLPENLVPDGSGNPLLKDEAFLRVQCPRCGAAARRETDTMDTFVDSSWYFLRFACSRQ
jgi:leucyl-tRNA synthetase